MSRRKAIVIARVVSIFIVLMVAVISALNASIANALIDEHFSSERGTNKGEPSTSAYAKYLGKTVYFCGNQWDVVGINDRGYTIGTSAAKDTNAAPNSAMLLLHYENMEQKGKAEIEAITDKFEGSGALIGTNIYSGSNLQSAMMQQVQTCASNLGHTLEGAGVISTVLSTSEISKVAGPAHGDGGELTKQLFFPLSYAEAVQIPDDCQNDPNAYNTDGKHTCFLRSFSNFWWLRSPGGKSSHASVVFFDGTILSGGFSVDDEYNLARPSLQISLNSFPVTSGEQVILANRKYDVIGVGTQPFVTPVNGYRALPTMGDPGTVTLLYSGENISETPIVNQNSSTDTDKDYRWYLSTQFNTALNNTNIYDGSSIQAKLNLIHGSLGENAKAQILPRDIKTQNSKNTGATNETYGDGLVIKNQPLWALSYNEACAISTNLSGNLGGSCTDIVPDNRPPLAFADFWWLRSPGGNPSSASFVNADGSLSDIGSDVTSPFLLARPALRISSSSNLLTDIALGNNVMSLSKIDFDGGVDTLAVGQTIPVSNVNVTTANGNTYIGKLAKLTWTSSNPNIARVDSLGNVIGMSSTPDITSDETMNKVQICAETEHGEFKRCKTVRILSPGEATPDLEPTPLGPEPEHLEPEPEASDSKQTPQGPAPESLEPELEASDSEVTTPSPSEDFASETPETPETAETVETTGTATEIRNDTIYTPSESYAQTTPKELCPTGVNFTIFTPILLLFLAFRLRIRGGVRGVTPRETCAFS